MSTDAAFLEHGLSSAEVAERKASNLNRAQPPQTSRSYKQIVRQNLLTFLNLTLAIIGAVLISMGLYRDAFFATGLVIINALVGIIQEVIAKRRLDQIALLNRATATVVRDGVEAQIDPAEIVEGDLLRIGPGDQVLVDGSVVGGARMNLDESLLTGESDLIPKVAGDPVYSGSFCVSGSGAYVAEKVGADSLAGTITAGARTYNLVLTPLQHTTNVIIRLLLVVAGLYLAMVLIGAAIWDYPAQDTVIASAVVVGIVPTGLFLMITITYSMAAVRLAGKNALIQQVNAIESLSYVDIFCMDKTGTLTANKLNLTEILPIDGDEAHVRKLVGDGIASMTNLNKTAEAIAAACPGTPGRVIDEVPFSSDRKWSAISFEAGASGGTFAMGAPEMLRPLLQGGDDLPAPEGWADQGLRILLVAHADEVGSLHGDDDVPALPNTMTPLAWLGFSDELRPNSQQTLQQFRDAGITLKIISGDNPDTVAALARQAGFKGNLVEISGVELAGMSESDFRQAAIEGTIFGRITPEQKERLIKALRDQGHYVAMTGDGVNDVLSLKQANLGIAMQSGSQATRGAADIVLLHDTFEALPLAFREGQRIRRGLLGILGLFLTRASVVALVILCAAVVQAGFPFSPSHLAIITTVTVGFPTFALALFAHALKPPRNFVGSLIRFVVPASLTLAAVGFGLYGWLYFRRDVTVSSFSGGGIASELVLPAETQVARDALTWLLILGGLWLVVFAAPPIEWWAVFEVSTGDWRPTIVAALMLPVYIILSVNDQLRAFFELTRLSFANYLLVAALSTVWAIGLRYLWKHHLFERFIGYSAPLEK